MEQNPKKKGVNQLIFLINPLILLVRPAGFEPATYGLEVRCSIQLSYGRGYLILDDIILKKRQKATAFLPLFYFPSPLPDWAGYRINHHNPHLGKLVSSGVG